MSEHSPPLADIVEALLLASDAPLRAEDVRNLLDDEHPPSLSDIKATLEQLIAAAASRPLRLVEVAGGYRYQLSEIFSPWISKLMAGRPPRYSRALLEILALIAYRQPLTRADIEFVRGVSVNTKMIRTLLERGWIRIVGHKAVPGRPALYATTRAFLEYFNLRSLEELPELAAASDEELELAVAQSGQQTLLPEDYAEDQASVSNNSQDDSERV